MRLARLGPCRHPGASLPRAQRNAHHLSFGWLLVVMEPSAFRSVIRRLRGEVKKPC